MDIQGLSAIVTGAGSGLGLATAKRLSAQGAKVTLFDLNEAAGERAASEVGGRFAHVNVADEIAVATALDAASDAQGPARILVNCAGISHSMKTVGRDFAPHAIDGFRRTIEINLIGTFNMITQFAARAAALDEIDGERGVIANTASISAFDGQVGQAAYAASKGGVVGMTLPIARDLAQHKVRVVTIAPGIFLTPMMEGLPQQVQDSLAAQVPHPARLGKPDEYAQLVESIVRNPMLNGEVIRLDGAIRMAPR